MPKVQRHVTLISFVLICYRYCSELGRIVLKTFSIFERISVVTVSEAECNGVRHGHVRVTHPFGYLSNYITESRGYGSLTCPWRIELQRGERINITLIDFTTPRYASG